MYQSCLDIPGDLLLLQNEKFLAATHSVSILIYVDPLSKADSSRLFLIRFGGFDSS